ncbi:MAG: M48 family metallopeptidase [Xanthomonadaceae bacterium]|nr:M48 family metallopeptidase [Xanthomonadaceae bacterium]
MNAKALAAGVAIALSLAACATTTSPTGRTQYVGAVSQGQLEEMGLQAFSEAKTKTPLSKDARLTAEVGCVVAAITAQLSAPWNGVHWEYALFQSDETNAWALPGGRIGVYTGIFKVAKTQDELAAVLAHEIGHVVARHHEERITRQLYAQLGLGVAGDVLGARYGEGAQQTTGQVGGALLQGAFLLPNSRTQETEADVVGQDLMAKAGFNPEGAVLLWRNMAAANEARPPQWLSTHPDPASRLRELQARAAGLIPVMLSARKAGHTPRCQ